MPPEEIYSKLSRIYNTVMHKVRYDRWSEYLLAVVELYMNDKAEVLEIAGGNCNFAGYFIEHFPKLIVTDKSFNMLASSKFINIPRICCDMIKLPFKSKFDLIYSTFDSVNYLTSRKRLLDLFKGVKEILKEEGIFTFDVSLERNSLLHVEKPQRGEQESPLDLGLVRPRRLQRGLSAEHRRVAAHHVSPFHASSKPMPCSCGRCRMRPARSFTGRAAPGDLSSQGTIEQAPRQAVKLCPQPQLPFAFGFFKAKPAPMRPST